MATRSPVSIIVPTLNEVGNIRTLITRIETALARKSLRHEIIVIDDRSTDGTPNVVQNLRADGNDNLALFAKKGRQGKAYSLLEGFELAHHEFICMIDADLQYPPEAIPPMLARIDDGFDIVVANRIQPETSWLRTRFSQLGRNLYGKWLHKLDIDVQSGLKLFRKEILSHVQLTPTAWTFDLEFLVQARAAGYKIGTIDVHFEKRSAGTSDIHMIRSGLEILAQAVKLKFARPKTKLVSGVTDDGVTKSHAV